MSIPAPRSRDRRSLVQRRPLTGSPRVAARGEAGRIRHFGHALAQRSAAGTNRTCPMQRRGAVGSRHRIRRTRGTLTVACGGSGCRRAASGRWRLASVPSHRKVVNPVRPGREQRQRRTRVPGCGWCGSPPFRPRRKGDRVTRIRRLPRFVPLPARRRILPSGGRRPRTPNSGAAMHLPGFAGYD